MENVLTALTLLAPLFIYPLILSVAYFMSVRSASRARTKLLSGLDYEENDGELKFRGVPVQLDADSRWMRVATRSPSFRHLSLSPIVDHDGFQSGLDVRIGHASFGSSCEVRSVVHGYPFVLEFESWCRIFFAWDLLNMLLAPSWGLTERAGVKLTWMSIEGDELDMCWHYPSDEEEFSVEQRRELLMRSLKLHAALRHVSSATIGELFELIAGRVTSASNPSISRALGSMLGELEPGARRYWAKWLVEESPIEVALDALNVQNLGYLEHPVSTTRALELGGALISEMAKATDRQLLATTRRPLRQRLAAELARALEPGALGDYSYLTRHRFSATLLAIQVWWSEGVLSATAMTELITSFWGNFSSEGQAELLDWMPRPLAASSWDLLSLIDPSDLRPSSSGAIWRFLNELHQSEPACVEGEHATQLLISIIEVAADDEIRLRAAELLRAIGTVSALNWARDVVLGVVAVPPVVRSTADRIMSALAVRHGVHNTHGMLSISEGGDRAGGVSMIDPVTGEH